MNDVQRGPKTDIANISANPLPIYMGILRMISCLQNIICCFDDVTVLFIRRSGRPYVLVVMFFINLFCHQDLVTIDIWLNFIIQVQKFGGCPQKNLGPKTCKMWCYYTQLPTLIANISGTSQDIQNRKDKRSRMIPSPFGERRALNFGPLTTK